MPSRSTPSLLSISASAPTPRSQKRPPASLKIQLPTGKALEAFGEEFVEDLPEAGGPAVRILVRAGSAAAGCAWRFGDAREFEDWGLPETGRGRYRFMDVAFDPAFGPHALLLGFLKKEAGLDDEAAFAAMAQIFRSLDASDRGELRSAKAPRRFRQAA